MVILTPAHHDSSSPDLPDSWTLQSHMTLVTSDNVSGEERLEAMRVSIGEFMERRTEALGSLGGGEHHGRVS